MRIVRVLMALCACAALASAAHAQTVVGKWTVHYPMRIHNQNGQITADTGVAVVTIEQNGDSVKGTWVATNTPVPSTPRTFAGIIKNGALTFTGAPVPAKVNRDGVEETIEMVTYFEAKVDGDKLTGTMHSQSLDGSISSPPMPWNGERAKE